MKPIKRHPLYHTADQLKRGFALHGFTLYDNGEEPELEEKEKSFDLFPVPDEYAASPVFLEDEAYAMRSSLLSALLPKMKTALPIKGIAAGRIYDRRDPLFPTRMMIEGVYADRDLTLKDLKELLTKIVKEIYGVGADVVLTAENRDVWKMEITTEEETFFFGLAAKANWLAKTLLDTDKPGVDTWILRIEVDALALHDAGFADRAALYSCDTKFPTSIESDAPAFGDTFANKAADLLRRRGYLEFCGLKAYEPDCYKKMNMIQEAWDKNNDGIDLAEPLAEKYTWLPTVLTPSLEEALAANYKAGKKEVRIFEIGHIFLPNPKGGAPMEKTALSFGCYGPDTDIRSFKAEVDAFLTELGIKNHFFIPTDLAIAYHPAECNLILDEKMNYLSGNFGGISPKAEANHGIGVHAFMAQLELKPLEEKVKEEYAFTPPELS